MASELKHRSHYLPKLSGESVFGLPHLKSHAREAFNNKTNGKLANTYSAHPYIDERYDMASMNYYERNKQKHIDTSSDPFAFSHAEKSRKLGQTN